MGEEWVARWQARKRNLESELATNSEGVVLPDLLKRALALNDSAAETYLTFSNEFARHVTEFQSDSGELMEYLDARKKVLTEEAQKAAMTPTINVTDSDRAIANALAFEASTLSEWVEELKNLENREESIKNSVATLVQTIEGDIYGVDLSLIKKAAVMFAIDAAGEALMGPIYGIGKAAKEAILRHEEEARVTRDHIRQIETFCDCVERWISTTNDVMHQL